MHKFYVNNISLTVSLCNRFNTIVVVLLNKFNQLTEIFLMMILIQNETSFYKLMEFIGKISTGKRVKM